MLIPVVEIFGPTIQGEGPHVGMKTMFLRVAGCDFHCSWCDSKYAWEVRNARSYEEEELADLLVKECLNHRTRNLIITGGNPCLYNFEYIVNQLHRNDITVDIETQGSLLPKWLHKVDQVVISPKGPSSGMTDVFDQLKSRLPTINVPVCIKIPVFNEEDFEFAERYYGLVADLRRENKNIDLYLSVGNTDTSEEGPIASRVLQAYEKLVDRVASSNMGRVFVLPQVHTLIWGNRQGV